MVRSVVTKTWGPHDSVAKAFAFIGEHTEIRQSSQTHPPTIRTIGIISQPAEEKVEESKESGRAVSPPYLPALTNLLLDISRALAAFRLEGASNPVPHGTGKGYVSPRGFLI